MWGIKKARRGQKKTHMVETEEKGQRDNKFLFKI